MEKKSPKEERILAAARMNIDLTARLIGRVIRGVTLHKRIAAALEMTPGGSAVDRYFGISSGKPQQPRREARRAEKLVGMLKNADDPETYSRLTARLYESDGPSGLDQEALRALMYRRPKPENLN